MKLSNSSQPKIDSGTYFPKIFQWNYLWLTLCAVGFAIFLMGMPKYLDDWDVASDFRRWFEMQGEVSPQSGGNILKFGFPWHDLKECIHRHFTVDNARISNIFGMVMILLPKWLGSLPSWLCWIYAMYGSLKIAKVDIGKSSLTPVVIFLWIMALPWYDNMGCIMFQVNYMIPSAMVIWLLTMMWDNRGRKEHYILIFILSFVAGAWHEMVSSQMIAAFTAILVICRPTDKKVYLFALAGLTLGLVWLVSFPCFYVRAGKSMFHQVGGIRNWIKIIILHHYIIPVYWVCAAAYIRRNGWKKYIGDRLNIVTLVVSLISLCFALFTNVEKRSGWLGDFFSIIGIAYLLLQLYPHYWSSYRTSAKIWGALLLTTSLGTLYLSDYYVLTYGKEYRKACQKYGEGENDSIFTGIEPPDITPFPVLRFIPPEFEWELMGYVKAYYNRPGVEGHLKLVPARLQDFSYEDGFKMPGDNRIRVIDGKYLVVPYDDMDSDTVYFDLDLGMLHQSEVAYLMIPFANRRDGKRYAVLIMTGRQIFKQILGINRMDLNSNYLPRIYRNDHD